MNAVIFIHGYGANGNDLIGIADIWIKVYQIQYFHLMHRLGDFLNAYRFE